MLPSIDIRISNLIKALETTIIPSLDPEASLAKEQAALVVGHLRVLNQQWDGAYLFELGSLKALTMCARSLLAEVEGGCFTTTAAASLKEAFDQLPETLPLTITGINHYIQSIGHAMDALINASFKDGSAEYYERLSSLVLAYAERQVLRERTWFQATGLDPDKEALGTINEMLQADS